MKLYMYGVGLGPIQIRSRQKTIKDAVVAWFKRRYLKRAGLMAHKLMIVDEAAGRAKTWLDTEEVLTLAGWIKDGKVV